MKTLREEERNLYFYVYTLKQRPNFPGLHLCLTLTTSLWGAPAESEDIHTYIALRR
jgi:hypothetical protein